MLSRIRAIVLDLITVELPNNYGCALSLMGSPLGLAHNQRKLPDVYNLTLHKSEVKHFIKIAVKAVGKSRFVILLRFYWTIGASVTEKVTKQRTC